MTRLKGKIGAGHCRGSRHRPRHRGGLHRRRREGHRDRSRGRQAQGSEKAAKCAKLDVLSTESVDAFAKTIIKGIRRARCSRQCRRLCASGHGARMLGAGLGLFLRPQRQIHAPHHQGLPARHAEERRRLDRQYVVGRILDQRPAEPLRLWRDQGGRHRPDQSGRRRLHHARASAAMRSAPAPSSRLRFDERIEAVAKETGKPLKAGARRTSSTASRWRGSAPPRKSPRSRCFWPPMNRATSPASRTWSMAAWRFNACGPPLLGRRQLKVGLAFRQAKAR